MSMIIIQHEAKSAFGFGVQIDLVKKRIRGYSSLFTFKFGQWEKISPDDYLTFLRTKETEKDDTPYYIWETYLDTDIGIYLGNKTHNRTLFLTNHRTYPDALEKVKYFSESTGIPFIETIPNIELMLQPGQNFKAV